jgi:hypothetical protein
VAWSGKSPAEALEEGASRLDVPRVLAAVRECPPWPSGGSHAPSNLDGARRPFLVRAARIDGLSLRAIRCLQQQLIFDVAAWVVKAKAATRTS